MMTTDALIDPSTHLLINLIQSTDKAFQVASRTGATHIQSLLRTLSLLHESCYHHHHNRSVEDLKSVHESGTASLSRLRSTASRLKLGARALQDRVLASHCNDHTHVAMRFTRALVQDAEDKAQVVTTLERAARADVKVLHSLSMDRIMAQWVERAACVVEQIDVDTVVAVVRAEEALRKEREREEQQATNVREKDEKEMNDEKPLSPALLMLKRKTAR